MTTLARGLPRGDRSAPPKTAAVVGGGIAGLAAAALLAREGYDVDLLEQQEQLGGRIGSWEADGFRFDTGPSWYLMPEVFEHFFGLFGRSAAEALDLVRLDPGYRVFFEKQNESIDISAHRSDNVSTFERIEPGAGAIAAKGRFSGRAFALRGGAAIISPRRGSSNLIAPAPSGTAT